MKFCEVRDKWNGYALARRHSAFLAGNQENLRKKICAGELAVVQQPGLVILVPPPERNLPRAAINCELDASGKSPAYGHRRINQPAPGNRPRDFL
jgi:hypothetical protein